MILVQSMEFDGPAVMPVISPTAPGLADVTIALSDAYNLQPNNLLQKRLLSFYQYRQHFLFDTLAGYRGLSPIFYHRMSRTF